jgi:FK506-binding protein 1
MASEFSKEVLSPGNGKDFPKKGDRVTMEYTGWLYDTSKPDNKGKQ